MGDVLQWRLVMQVVLGVTILGAAGLLISRVAGHAMRWTRGDVIAAVYQMPVGDRSIEVEIDRDGTPVRLRVDVSPSIQYRAVDRVNVVLDPQDPTRAVAVDFSNFWRRLLNPLCFLVAGVVVWINLSRTQWGQDRTWSGGAWTATRAGALVPASEPNAVVFRPTLGIQRYQIIVLAVFGFLAVGGAYGLVRNGAGMATLTFLLSFGMTCILAGIVVDTRTLHLVASDVGLTEKTFFGAKRIPWSEIHGLERRNLNEKAQRDYNASDITRFQKGASRPPTIYVDFIVDAKKQEILSLSDEMEPKEAFRALRNRLHARGSARTVR